MLTNELLKYYTQDGRNAGDCEVEDMARELLTLREAVAPQMAEVDALMKDLSWVGESVLESDGYCYVLDPNLVSLADKLRTAILACEQQKQRADNLQLERDGAVACMDSRLKEIESLTAQLSAIRDAGDEEFEDLLDSIPAPELNEKWVKLTGEMECLRNDLHERDAEIERLKGDNAALLKQWNDLDLRNEKRHHEWTEKLLTLTAERDELLEKIAAYECEEGI